MKTKKATLRQSEWFDTVTIDGLTCPMDRGEGAAKLEAAGYVRKMRERKDGEVQEAWVKK